MRGPIIFVCVGGNMVVFRDEAHATIGAEAIDVVNGEYGKHGWDADGRPIALEARLPEPGPLEKILRLRKWIIPSGTVEARALDVPPEPDVLRSVLLKFWVEYDPARGASLSTSSLVELVDSVLPFIEP